MERDRFEPMEGFENKDRGTLWWRTSHRSDTHLQILRVRCPPNGSILNAVLWVKPESGAVFPLCIHVIGLDGVFMLFTSRIRIHALSIAHACCHMCPGAVWQREKYIYLKTVSQLSKFVQSVLFTSIHSIINQSNGA